MPKSIDKKTKPKCVKGTACGFTCISGKNQCSDKVLKRDADALIKSAVKPNEAKIDGTVNGLIDSIKPYNVDKVLGEGAFGEAVLTDRGTVIKTAFKGTMTENEVKQEYLALEQFHKLGIGPKPIGLDGMSLEMGLVKGDTLGEVVSKDPALKSTGLSDELRAKSVSTLLKLHKSGWTHNDVGFHNLIQQPDGSIALIDGGAAGKVGDVKAESDGYFKASKSGYFDMKWLLTADQKTNFEKALSKPLEGLRQIVNQGLPKMEERESRAKDFAKAHKTIHEAYLKAADDILGK